MWSTRRESPTSRGERQQHESGGRDRRTQFRERERPRRDQQRTQFRERSRSPEREHRYRLAACPQRYAPSCSNNGRLGRGHALRSAERGAERRHSPGNTRLAPLWPPPPPPPSRRPDGGIMQMMSVSRGRATSADALRPKASAHDSRALTQDLGKARDLPELLSLEERYGIVLTVSILMPFGAGSRSCPLVASSAGCAIVLRPCAS